MRTTPTVSTTTAAAPESAPGPPEGAGGRPGADLVLHPSVTGQGVATAAQDWWAEIVEGSGWGVAGALAAALGAAAAMVSLAVAQPAHLAPETWYLAMTATLALCAIALLAPPPRPEARAAALFAAALIWLVPVGPQRGAAVTLLLLGALGVAVARRMAAPSPRLPLAAALGAALAAQVFLRAETLLPAALDSAALLRLGLPVVAAGAALWWLGRREPRTALVAGGLAALAAGGVTATAAASLVAVAAARELARSRAHWSLGRPEIIASLGALLMTGLWSPRLGILAGAAALLAATSSRAALAAPAAALVAGLFLPAAGADPARALWLALALLPVALVPGALPPRLWAGGALLVAAGAFLLPGSASLALPLALLALELDPRRPELRAQGLWLALLLGAALAAASYPWLRVEPLADVLELSGVPLTLAAVLAAVAVAALAWLARRSGRLALAAAALGLAGLGVVVTAPRAGGGTELLAGVPVTVDSSTDTWQREVEIDGPVGHLLLDSALANSLALAPGTVVATVVLESPQGSARWPLRAGKESGEWAARRFEDSEGSSPAATPWIAWVAPPGEHFGQWYRARWKPAEPLHGVTSVRVEREPGLSPEVAVSIARLELRP